MSQGNVEIYRTYIEGILGAASELDLEAAVPRMAEYWDPEFELDTSEGPIPELTGVYCGTEAAQQWWQEWFDAWETLQFEYELVDGGDRIAMLLDLRMRGRSSGVEVALGKHAWVTTFKEGLMVHSKLYMSQSEALEVIAHH